MVSVTTRVTSARFVGGPGELVELAAALRDAAYLPPSRFVAGESGVGKSRLVEELTRHAREPGSRVLSGDGVELGEDELPYAPLPPRCARWSAPATGPRALPASTARGARRDHARPR